MSDVLKVEVHSGIWRGDTMCTLCGERADMGKKLGGFVLQC
jgi:hypothetical protein